MNILYHMTVLPPKMPACEALSQEISALRRHFNGDLIYLNPNIDLPLYLPRLVFGFHKLLQIRRMEKKIRLHHLYNPDPFPFPIVRFWRRPVVYSITSGIEARQPYLPFLAQVAAIVVPDERSFQRLQAWGLHNVFLVRAGINTHRFSHTPLPLQKEIRVMVGSAPWTEAQFRSKGVDALLEAARLEPRLHLVFLWRGVLAESMKKRVAEADVGSQITVINKQVDVNAVLAKVHAGITLATKPGIVKSYPHSLLDTLAAGKPVLVSRAIPMADYVENVGCGVVVEQVTAGNILNAVEALREDYVTLQQTARVVGQKDFTEEAMLNSFEKVYAPFLAQKS